MTLPVSTNCSGRTVTAVDREEALAHFYAAERRAGACPLVANERLHFFAKRLDADFESDLAVIRSCMERVS